MAKFMIIFATLLAFAASFPMHGEYAKAFGDNAYKHGSSGNGQQGFGISEHQTGYGGQNTHFGGHGVINTGHEGHNPHDCEHHGHGHQFEHGHTHNQGHGHPHHH